MAYDEELAERFREALGGDEGVSEKRMMGGVCFLLNGNMIGGADRTKEGARRFMFRVGKDNHDEALKRPGAMPMDMGGRRMSGFVFVDAENCDDGALNDWIMLARSFVDGLPAK
ncbi:MAG: TfoX/Sxy family protein [Geminicoccaceae bacterium]